MKKELTNLELILKSHDWYYERTDDPRLYKKGESERRQIEYLLRVTGGAGQKLLKKYSR